jgi:hypothetical protein
MMGPIPSSSQGLAHHFSPQRAESSAAGRCWRCIAPLRAKGSVYRNVYRWFARDCTSPHGGGLEEGKIPNFGV